MKVQVKNVKIEKGERDLFNTNMEVFLSIGNIYIVYAISIIKRYTYYHIYR